MTESHGVTSGTPKQVSVSVSACKFPVLPKLAKVSGVRVVRSGTVELGHLTTMITTELEPISERSVEA